MDQFTDFRYYERIGPGYENVYEPGCLFRAPVHFVEDRKYICILQVEQQPPPAYRYKLEEVDITRFRPRDYTPLYELGLGGDDFVTLVGSKIRPIIILTPAVPKWSTMKRTSTDCFLAAPIYSVKNLDGTYRFGRRFLRRVQAFEFPHLFYLPQDDDIGFEEGLVRFEFIQAVPRDWLRPMNLRLADDAFYILSARAVQYLNPELLDNGTAEILDYIRQERLETLSKMPPLPE